MHYLTDRITDTMVFVTPVVEHLLEQEIKVDKYLTTWSKHAQRVKITRTLPVCCFTATYYK